MTKLVPILSFVISFVLCVQSYRISYDLDSWSNLDQEDMMGEEKNVQFERKIYPSAISKIDTKIGQVGGVDTLANGNLLVFHRNYQIWTFDTFFGNNFNTRKYGKIEKETITLIDSESSTEIGSWGKNMFYMPHGLTVDFEGKVWITDVGLHQVMKFDMKNMEKPELVLGEELVLGNDDSHFCKPTDVAISKTDGHIFVSDGYCNQRVVEFDKNGKFVKSYQDENNPLVVVHSITLIESDDIRLVCTVSREAGRIVCFDVKTGKKAREITHSKMRTVYAIKYDPINHVLHAATGENHNNNHNSENRNHNKEPTGFTFDVSDFSKDKFGTLLGEWNVGNTDLARVHDLTISPDGSKIFLGQLNSEIDLLSYK